MPASASKCYVLRISYDHLNGDWPIKRFGMARILYKWHVLFEAAKDSEYIEANCDVSINIGNAKGVSVLGRNHICDCR